MNAAAKTGLREFVGADYRLEPLKPIGLRARNLLKPWLIRTPARPMPWLVHATDGRRYKLLPFSRKSLERRQPVLDVLRALEPVASAPKVVWRDAENVVVEWVEGETPVLADAAFARSLGEAFADLHRVGLREAPAGDVVRAARADAVALCAAGHLSAAAADALPAALASALPARIPRAMLYRDQTLANFLVDAKGGLHMIDLGSFQPDLPIDVFWVGSEVYRGVDRTGFREAYTAAGGSDFLFRHEPELELVQLARRCARDARVIDRTSALERRRLRQLRQGFARRLQRLHERLESSA